MRPNLRSVLAQGCWKSIGSRRSFYSSPGGSNGEMIAAFKSAMYPSFTKFNFNTWAMYGYAIYGGHELYQLIKLFRIYFKLEERDSRIEERKRDFLKKRPNK